MKPNYFEYIIVYLSVLVTCVLIGALARLFVVGAGADEFTANIVFWAVTALGVIAYAVLNLLIEGLFTANRQEIFPEERNLENVQHFFRNSSKFRSYESRSAPSDGR
ncbi:hypothetical protein [Porphyromonas pogonae]|uniref:hypothetical protein n=1 Tax=Porphyromonas pogonae TaxID=867595 RepID=UPI002E798261|nr:hypothetical protein [Porphyromonas pogonae]